MLEEKGAIALDPPPLASGKHFPGPGDPPESTAAGPTLADSVRMAQAALDACTKAGFRVGVAVVDSVGEARAMLTADRADGSDVFVAMRKTEVVRAFDRPSREANRLLRDNPTARARLTPAMFVEGGAVPIRRGGKLIGALGVSGATGTPIGHDDEVCEPPRLSRRHFSFESCGHIEGLNGCIVVGFGFGRWDMPDGAEQAMVIEPVNPAQRCHFHGRYTPEM